MKRTSLYELTGQFLELLQMADEQVFDQKTINDTMECVEAEIEEKAEGYAMVIRTLESEVDSITAEIQRLTARKKMKENNIESMKRNLENSMLVTGKKKFKTALFSFGIQKNTPSLDILDESKIPERFWIPQEPKLDRTGALKFIKEHGDQEWGKTKQTESLRIR